MRLRLEQAERGNAEAEKRARLRLELEQQENRLCGVCMDQQRSTAMVPCGHTFCGDCAARQMAQAQRLCPECRAPIQLTTRVFGI